MIKSNYYYQVKIKTMSNVRSLDYYRRHPPKATIARLVEQERQKKLLQDYIDHTKKEETTK